MKSDLKAHMAKASLAFYANEFIRGPLSPPYNGKFMVADHHQEWSDLVNRYKRLCINASRDHGKSHMLTLAYPLWMAEKYPGERGFIFSSSQPQADLLLSKIQLEVEQNPKLRHMLPDLSAPRKMWSTKQMRFANGFELYARGYGTKVRGVHPIFVVLDDVLNDNDAYSGTVRDKNIEYYYSAIRPTLVPGGQVVCVGTPMAAQDLYGNLAKNPEYFFKRYPAILDEGTQHERALWPERYSLEELKRLKRELGNLRFTREYMALPVSDDASLFPSSLFHGEPVEQYNLKLGEPYQFWADHGITNIYIGVDFAISANTGADYTVLFVMAVDGRGTRWVVDIIREHGLSFSSQKSLIVSAARRYNPQIIFLESNQCQRIFGDELIRLTDLPIKLFQMSQSKHSLETGIPALRLLLENQKVRIPRGDSRSVAITDIWIDEMRSMAFTTGKVFSTGQHDDTVAGFFICENAIKSGSFTFDFNEREGDAEVFDMEEHFISNPDDEDLEYYGDDYTVGSNPYPKAGPPKRINAQLVDGLDLGDASDAKSESGAELKAYKDVQPKLGAPTFWKR